MIGLMLLTSKGAAGVTGSGFVALVATLAVFPTLPVAGVALIVGIDRFMSEARALTSTMSNIVASIVVSKWEKAVDEDTLQAELTTGYRTPRRTSSTAATSSRTSRPRRLQTPRTGKPYRLRPTDRQIRLQHLSNASRPRP